MRAFVRVPVNKVSTCHTYGCNSLDFNMHGRKTNILLSTIIPQSVTSINQFVQGCNYDPSPFQAYNVQFLIGIALCVICGGSLFSMPPDLEDHLAMGDSSQPIMIAFNVLGYLRARLARLRGNRWGVLI